jgi:hypothetical protein
MGAITTKASRIIIVTTHATALLPHPPAILKHLYSTQYLLTEWPCRYHDPQ